MNTEFNPVSFLNVELNSLLHELEYKHLELMSIYDDTDPRFEDANLQEEDIVMQIVDIAKWLDIDGDRLVEEYLDIVEEDSYSKIVL